MSKKVPKKNSSFASGRFDPNNTYKGQRTSGNDQIFTSPKQRKTSENSDIPSALKRNILALSESSDSLKLTEFGKSFIQDASPPTKKVKSREFEKILNESGTENSMLRKIEPKRLSNLRMESVQVGLLSSPSIMEAKKSAPKLAFPIDSESKLKTSETIVKLKPSNVQDVKDVKQNKIEKNKKEEKPYETLLKSARKEVKIVPEKSSTIHSSRNMLKNSDITETGREIIKNFRKSSENIRKMITRINAISQKLRGLCQEMCLTPSIEVISSKED